MNGFGIFAQAEAGKEAGPSILVGHGEGDETENRGDDGGGYRGGGALWIALGDQVAVGGETGGPAAQWSTGGHRDRPRCGRGGGLPGLREKLSAVRLCAGAAMAAFGRDAVYDGYPCPGAALPV